MPNAERFASKTTPEPNSGCLLWTTACYPNGYGAFCVNGRNRYAHRVAWQLAFGPIPQGLFVCHKCDVRSCVNPKHLFLGTTNDNMADMVSKGRCARGERSGLTKLTTACVKEIRERHAVHGEKLKDIAARFGICLASVGLICQRKRWGHVS